MRTDLPWGELVRLTEDREGRKAGRKIQRRSNKAWANEHGVKIEYHWDDTNLSAGDEDVYRPDYEEALEFLRQGRIGGLVVYKIDRLTRLAYEYERILRIVRRSGTTVAESYYGGQTTDTPAGQQALRFNVANAEAEIQNIKVRVQANKNERARKGHYHGGGHRPYGFVGPKKKGGRLKNSGDIGVKHVPHEVERLREAAQRRLEGETYTDIVNDWHSQEPPVYGATGVPWSTKTLETILTSPRMIAKRVYREKDPKTGEVVEILRKAKWKPVLEQDQWERLNALRGHQEHAPMADYELSGIAVCGRCGHHLTGSRRNYRKGGVVVGTRTYRCRSGTNDKARGACGRLSVLAEDVENLIRARLFRRLERTAQIMGAVLDDDQPRDELGSLADEIAFCNRELEALAKAAEDPKERMSTAQLLAYRKPFVRRLEVAEGRRREILSRLSVPVPEGDDFADLPAWFEALTIAQRQQLVREAFAEIRVLPPGRSGRYFRPERVVATPAGA